MAILISPCVCAETSPVIVVGGDFNYPPYEFLDDKGSPSGYNVELTREIAEVMGLKVEFRLGQWSDIREELRLGQIDVLQGMIYSKERDKHFDFSPPHALVHQSVFARRGEPGISSLEELGGSRVIVQRDGIMHDLLVQRGINARLVFVDTHVAALLLLSSGKHDYAMVANLPGFYLERERGLSNIVPVFKVSQGLLYSYAVRDGHHDLLAQFSEGLAILKNTQRYKKIYDKWLGVLESGPIPWRTIGWIAGIASIVLLLILGFAVVWNRTLQLRVDERTQELDLRQQQLIQADKMTSLGILVSGMAHEINNPNSLLLMNLPMVKDVFEDAGEALEEHYEKHGEFHLGGIAYSRMRDELPVILDDMYDGVQRIKRIVEDLKDFSRQGSAFLNETVDLNNITRKAVRLMDNSIRQATHAFKTEYAPELPPFKGNAQRIEQVIVNLILNACQALESPEQSIKVTTRHDASQRTVLLVVMDEGRGIASQQLPQLISPFYTTKRATGGTGLGLSVSAGIVREHYGTIEFDSAPGKGMTVTMTLPIDWQEISS